MGERLLIVSSVGAVVGAWLGAFVIPLDWERPWQVRMSIPRQLEFCD